MLCSGAIITFCLQGFVCSVPSFSCSVESRASVSFEGVQQNVVHTDMQQQSEDPDEVVELVSGEAEKLSEGRRGCVMLSSVNRKW
jgi:hypothetical protein